MREVRAQVPELEKTLASAVFDKEDQTGAEREFAKLKREAAKLTETGAGAPALVKFPKAQRQVYEKVFSLIYECAPNRLVAKSLVDRIMARLGAKD